MSTLASQLREIVAYIHGYYLIPIFIFGIAGNLMNVIIFSRNTLKHTTCSLYFISLSIIHVFVLCFGCLTRIVITLSGFDLTRYSLFFCKFRVYFFVAGIAISRYYLCLISIDRWLVTSLNAPTRRLSNFPIIRRILIISTIAWLIFNLHVPIGFRQEANGCVPSSDGFYLTFYLVTNLNFAIVPFVIIILFSTLTLQRVTKRKLIRKHNAIVYPIGPVERSNTRNRNERISHKNIQLIKLNLIQVIFFIFLNLPNTIYTLYSFITKTYEKSTDQISIDNFFNYMSSNLLYTHCAISFYIYTLASITFRKEFISIVGHIQQYILTFIHR